MADDRCPECGGYRTLPRMLHDQDEPRECTNEFHKSSDIVAIEPDPEPVPLPPETPAPEATSIVKPVCPYCGQEGKIKGTQTNLGPFQVIVVSCRNEKCRKVLGVFQALELQPMPPPGLRN